MDTVIDVSGSSPAYVYLFIEAMAAKIVSKGSYAVSIAKAAINNGYDMDIKNAVEMEANLFGVTCSTHDKAEGMTAFLEKRAANLTDF